MSKVVISVDQWPSGLSLSIGNDNFVDVVAGSHGGGTGYCLKQWKVDANRLIEVINKYKEAENE